MLDAHQINIFLVAAETLNFTQAAERLHMSQPSVSQHIRALEKHFGEELFIRQGRSLILSDAGRILIPLARQFVKQSTCINETISSLKGHIKGRISIGCNAISGKYIMPEFFGRFHKHYPEVSIFCQTDSCASPLEELRRSNLHFLFTNKDQGMDPCFEVHNILTEEINLITPLDHPWACRNSVEIEELIDEEFILPLENTNTYNIVNTALASKNLSLLQLKSFLTLSNAESIVISVEKGIGVAFCSKIISSTIGNVASIPIKDLSINLGFAIVRDKTQLSTAARDAFWEYVSTVSDEIKQSIGA
jgi:DNA-binding transcriptional LysR family regulator